MNEKRLVISEAAAIVNCHPETLRRLDRKGILKAKRDYRGFRIYTLAELLKLKNEREQLEY